MHEQAVRHKTFQEYKPLSIFIHHNRLDNMVKWKRWSVKLIAIGIFSWDTDVGDVAPADTPKSGLQSVRDSFLRLSVQRGAYTGSHLGNHERLLKGD